MLNATKWKAKIPRAVNHRYTQTLFRNSAGIANLLAFLLPLELLLDLTPFERVGVPFLDVFLSRKCSPIILQTWNLWSKKFSFQSSLFSGWATFTAGVTAWRAGVALLIGTSEVIRRPACATVSLKSDWNYVGEKTLTHLFRIAKTQKCTPMNGVFSFRHRDFVGPSLNAALLNNSCQWNKVCIFKKILLVSYILQYEIICALDFKNHCFSERRNLDQSERMCAESSWLKV